MQRGIGPSRPAGRGLWAAALALTLAPASLALAQPEPPRTAEAAPTARFGQELRYLVGSIEVRGNRRTETSLILGELGIALGDVLTPDDPRVPVAELRLRALGFFVSVQLRLERLPTRRGEVILIVEVEERGTRVLNALYLGSSEATRLWGGLDVAETNLFGRGLVVGAGVLASTRPVVPEAQAARAVSLRAAGPARNRDLLLAGNFIYSSGSEFYQTSGREDDADPTKWSAVAYRRVGGSFSIGSDLSRTARFYAEGRFESVEARLPSLRTRNLEAEGVRPVDFQIHQGGSRLASVGGTLDLDTRSDPVLPRSGHRMVISLEAALPLFSSSYSYAKGVAQGSIYFPTAAGHVFALHGFGGAVLGEAPFFARFFIGDLNFLLPPRALGLNFSTQPSRNVFGNSASRRRYESVAGRAVVEYAIPLWRRGRFAYRGDAFAAFGVFGLADLEDLVARDTSLRRSTSSDLTGDLGVRLDTNIGIFTLSIANAIGRLPL